MEFGDPHWGMRTMSVLGLSVFGIDISISLSPMVRSTSFLVSYTETSANIKLVSIYQGILRES